MGFAIEPSVKADFDVIVGPAVRQFGYYHIFTGVPGYYREIQSCGSVRMTIFDGLEKLFKITHAMKKMMNLTSTGASAAGKQVLVQCGKVSKILESHPYLGSGSGGDVFGGADLAWSALMGWVVLPGPNFHRGVVNLPDIGSWPAAALQLRQDVLKTRAGAHCIKCYNKHRLAR
jgi:hypothetical protein